MYIRILYTFTASLTVSYEPKLKDLANHVAAVIPGKWMEVAIQLDLTMGEIDSIEHDRNSSFLRFMAVFEQWKKSCRQPYTWESLITALKSTSVNEFRLAKKLQEEFC